jgi:hypothetical protein
MRLCKAKGKNAIFHTWVQFNRVIEPTPWVKGGTISSCLAVVEYEDGRAEQVSIDDIVFSNTEYTINLLQAMGEVR